MCSGRCSSRAQRGDDSRSTAVTRTVMLRFGSPMRRFLSAAASVRSGAAAGRQRRARRRRRRGRAARSSTRGTTSRPSTRTSRGSTERAIALESEVARTPSLDALLLLAWAHLLWADYRAPDVDAKLASYERGRDVAKRAIDMAPRSPDAHLWYAANLGRWALTKGKLQAAFLLSTLRQEIQTVLELDPDNVPGLAVAGIVLPRDPVAVRRRRRREPRDTCARRSRSTRTSRAPASSWPGVSSRRGATTRPDRS